MSLKFTKRPLKWLETSREVFSKMVRDVPPMYISIETGSLLLTSGVATLGPVPHRHLSRPHRQ